MRSVGGTAGVVACGMQAGIAADTCGDDIDAAASTARTGLLVGDGCWGERGAVDGVVRACAVKGASGSDEQKGAATFKRVAIKKIRAPASVYLHHRTRVPRLVMFSVKLLITPYE